MIFDAREATGHITEQDLEQLVQTVREAVRRGGMRGHVAILAADDALYASMVQYEAPAAEIGVRVIRVFRELPGAEQWLEIVSAARNLQ